MHEYFVKQNLQNEHYVCDMDEYPYRSEINGI